MAIGEGMRDQLDHLPTAKQRELSHVTRVLFEEFEAMHARGNQKWAKQGRILKVVLYGSYARGDWIKDRASGYTSDYDILVVVSDERLTDFEFWSPADDRLMRDMLVTERLSAPANFIVHSLNDVNAQLLRGRPFFVDIVDQGVVLYEAEGAHFAQPRLLPPEEAETEARAYFGEWFETACEFAAGAEFHRSRQSNKVAAFNYHQATERFYHCVLLVLTLYSPKSHRITFLRSRCEAIAPDLIAAWPRADKFSRRCFELLQQAYVKARYSPHYEVSAEELAWIGERVGVLQTLVREVCERRLGAL